MVDDPICVVVLDHEGCRLGMTNEDIATTLIAVVSEDPADWAEMNAYWPRYTTRVVPEFASSLPLETVDYHQMIQAIAETDSWIVLDLVQKRFLSGRSFQPITRDACFAMHTDEKGDQHDPLSIHFAPWWELHEQVDPAEVDNPRQSPIEVPFVDRDFLFGEPLFRDLAERILQIAETENGRNAICSNEENDLYPLTVEVHRAWLMTPREDLDGKIPRQLLHGGASWIDKIIWGHRLRFEQGGGKMIAAPTKVRSYSYGPMGGEEVAIYFDLCRELIGAGWFWCRQQFGVEDERPEVSEGSNSLRIDSENRFGDTANVQSLVNELVSFLRGVKDNWLHSSFEGGSPPAFILECSRRRVPRGAGVKIVGMSERQSERHLIDCDCPICNMMAEGNFGVGFTAIDGHHLELDDEFAFSNCETREEWEKKQREYEEFNAKFNREWEERQRKIASGEIDEDDEFASAWKGATGFGSDNPLGGDGVGDMQLAFMLAEIISEIQSTDETTDLVKQLNEDFTEFRNCEPENLVPVATQFESTLESVAEVYPLLTPRIADFQSRIAERLRTAVSRDEFSEDLDDFPF